MSITLQKMAGGVLFALIVLVGLNLLVNGFMPDSMPHPSQAEKIAEGGLPAQGAAAPTTTAAGQAPDKPLGLRLAQANVQKGAAAIKKCQSCHTFDQGGGAKVGPNLFGVVGRAKASAPGFSYSDGMKKLGGSWTYDDLDTFLTKPAAFAQGTKMTFAGLPDPGERADAIAYLKSISPDAPPAPSQ